MPTKFNAVDLESYGVYFIASIGAQNMSNLDGVYGPTAAHMKEGIRNTYKFIYTPYVHTHVSRGIRRMYVCMYVCRYVCMQMAFGGGSEPQLRHARNLHNCIGAVASHSTDQPSSLPSLQCLLSPPFSLPLSLSSSHLLNHPSTTPLSCMFPCSAMSLFLLHFFSLCVSLMSPTVNSLHKDGCASICGGIPIPFPFYPTLSDAFCLSCVNSSSSSLFITLASQSYRVLHFFPDGVLVDFPNTTSTCRQYNDLKSFSFSSNQYYGIAADNVLDLYDCEDSSLCKPDCETKRPGCEGQADPSCCYPLSDRSSWRPGDSFTKFSQYGCRGFSSWITSPGNTTGNRGVKLEWAVPGNSTEATCAPLATPVNVTSVASGIRCQCPDGFSGDGFSAGLGCLKSCFKDGKEIEGNECYRSKHGKKKAIILAGVITSIIALFSFVALYLLKRTIRSDKFVPDKSHSQISSQKVTKSRLFTYHELEEATKGFGDAQKIVDTTLYAGVLNDGSRVAVQKKVQCESEGESERSFIRVLFRLETLSAVSHRNMAHIVGWSIESSFGPLVVYEYPGNRTLKEHLCQSRDDDEPLDWYKRLNIAAETASVVAFLHHEMSPPVFHHDLQTGCIFLDMDYSVKLAGFELHVGEGSEYDSSRRNDVYSFGLVLVEIITGNTKSGALQKIKKGKVEEIVDPRLYYHEQPAYWREQMEIIGDLATRCLLFGGDGKLSMFDVAKELVHMNRDARRGPAMEETFSNSSLLQMISMSPDSIYTTNLN